MSLIVTKHQYSEGSRTLVASNGLILAAFDTAFILGINPDDTIGKVLLGLSITVISFSDLSNSSGFRSPFGELLSFSSTKNIWFLGKFDSSLGSGNFFCFSSTVTSLGKLLVSTDFSDVTWSDKTGLSSLFVTIVPFRLLFVVSHSRAFPTLEITFIDCNDTTVKVNDFFEAKN